MGDVVQCHHLAVPGLRRAKWVWESINQLVVDISWLIGQKVGQRRKTNLKWLTKKIEDLLGFFQLVQQAVELIVYIFSVADVENLDNIFFLENVV